MTMTQKLLLCLLKRSMLRFLQLLKEDYTYQEKVMGISTLLYWDPLEGPHVPPLLPYELVNLVLQVLKVMNLKSSTAWPLIKPHDPPTILILISIGISQIRCEIIMETTEVQQTKPMTECSNNNIQLCRASDNGIRPHCKICQFL